MDDLMPFTEVLAVCVPAAAVDDCEIRHFPWLTVLPLNNHGICIVVQFAGNTRKYRLARWRDSIQKFMQVCVAADFYNFDAK
ncbi:MAG TPA: hypothetical protein VFA81_08480 [Burkholderiales bacterium]|nr:hypothetical protein [Burkholderiales bacterium]